MLAAYKTKTNIGVGAGLIGNFIGSSLVGNEELSLLGVFVLIASVALFIWGCVQYAKGKGQSPWLGLLGLISIIGLIILVFIPDKNK